MLRWAIVAATVLGASGLHAAHAQTNVPTAPASKEEPSAFTQETLTHWTLEAGVSESQPKLILALHKFPDEAVTLVPAGHKGSLNRGDGQDTAAYFPWLLLRSPETDPQGDLLRISGHWGTDLRYAQFSRQLESGMLTDRGTSATLWQVRIWYGLMGVVELGRSDLWLSGIVQVGAGWANLDATVFFPNHNQRYSLHDSSLVVYLQPSLRLTAFERFFVDLSSLRVPAAGGAGSEISLSPTTSAKLTETDVTIGYSYPF